MSEEQHKVTGDIRQAASWQDFEDTAGTALEQSGATSRQHDGRLTSLCELDGTTLFRLHSLLPLAAIRDALEASGIALPLLVNQCQGQDPSVLCVAPGEWLLFSEYLGADRLGEQLRPAIEPHHTALIDLSPGLTVFRLAGKGSAWLLSKLTGLDFGKENLATAHCARTRLQHAAVTLHYHQTSGLKSEFVYDIIVERSFALYVWQLLIVALPHAEELAEQFGQPG
jgi:heterotetrameric sarcosine oxidase gamma subunit